MNPLDCVAAQGLAVRFLPAPLYLRGHFAALVPEEHGREQLDLAGSDIPVLDVAAAGDRTDVLWQLVAGAAALRLHRRDDRMAAYIGAGPTWETAVLRGLYTALARKGVRTDVSEVARVTGWQHAAGLDDLGLLGIDGQLECYLLAQPVGVPLIGAVLRLARSPHLLCATACDLRSDRAMTKAFHGLLRKFAITSLVRRHHGDDRNVLAAASGPNTTTEIDYADLVGRISREEPSLDDTAIADAPVQELAVVRQRMQRAGIRPRVQTLSPPGSGMVVRCRIEPGSPGSAECNSWGEPNVASMGLRAPRQMSLAYDRASVRISRMYHENSKMRIAYGTLPMVDIKDMAPPVSRLIGRAFRDFGHTKREYHLPKVGTTTRLLSLEECVRRRRSWAPINSRELSLEELGRLLHLSYGTTGTAVVGTDVRLPLRATPSAGGLYSSDMFIMVNCVTGIKAGLYYFHPGRHVLQLLSENYSLDEVAEYTGYASRARQAAAIIIYVGAFRRNQWKYWERGYRTVLLDCGHLAQSVVLIANSLGLVAHPMVAFVDNYFNNLVGVDGIDDAVLYLTLLGRDGRGEVV